MSDPNDRADDAAGDKGVDDRTVGAATDHETLSGFNAAQIVDDPDDLEPDEASPPVATPDSPNPI